MSDRPGALLGRRPLHFFVLADCSGSMASDGKMQALNHAIRETLPHLASVAALNPHAEVLVRVIAFSTGARWHLSVPTPADVLQWEDLVPGGFTDLGAALGLLGGALSVDAIEERALPPVLVLISDGQPTDDFDTGLARLMRQPWAQKAVRLAIAMGHDADLEVLQQFIGPEPKGGGR